MIRQDGPAIELLEHRSLGTRLGAGLTERGLLAAPAMRRTLEAVRTHARCARDWEASVVAIATSAVRRADNAAAFAAEFVQVAGVPLRVLDGRDEAACSFAGATFGIGTAKRIAVLDVGGGSTECAVGSSGSLAHSVSIEIGAVRLSERFPEFLGSTPGAKAKSAAADARVVAREALRPLRAFAPVDEVRAVAGTPLTLAAIVAASEVESVRGHGLKRTEIDAVVDRLMDLDLAQRRRLPGMIPQRADILAAGAIVVSEALDALAAAEAVLETNDLLLGYLLRTGPGAAGA